MFDNKKNNSFESYNFTLYIKKLNFHSKLEIIFLI
jgi:hypothetical protein